MIDPDDFKDADDLSWYPTGDIDDFSKMIQSLFTSASETNNRIFSQFAKSLQELEERVEKIDQQIATLVLAYGETAVFLESLVGQMAFASPEAQKAFHDSLNQNRRSMVEVMQNAAEGFLGDDSPGVGSALSDMAKQKLSDPTE